MENGTSDVVSASTLKRQRNSCDSGVDCSCSFSRQELFLDADVTCRPPSNHETRCCSEHEDDDTVPLCRQSCWNDAANRPPTRDDFDNVDGSCSSHAGSGRKRACRRRPQPSTQQRKLVLHFDVRNTILVFDSLTNDNVEQALNTFLAGVTWGRQVDRPACTTGVEQVDDGRRSSVGEDGGWQWCSDRPSLRAPCPGAITYYKSLERRLVRSTSDRLALRRVTGDFTHQPIGRKFRPFFDKHLKLLEWNCASAANASTARKLLRAEVASMNGDVTGNGNDDEDDRRLDLDACSGHHHNRKLGDPALASNGGHVTTGTGNLNVSDSCHHRKGDLTPTSNGVGVIDRKLTIFGSDGRLYNYLLPSFVKLIYDLQSAGRQFSIVLRTYGTDASNVLTSVEHIVTGHHPLFPRPLPIAVDRQPGRVRRSADGAPIRCEIHGGATTLDTDDAIYRAMSESVGVSGFVDDFAHWQDNDYSHQAGKPLWIDPCDLGVQHIFFDDNIRVTDDDSIVDVRLFDDSSDDVISGGRQQQQQQRQRTCRSMKLDEIASLENVCLVQADLLECTSDIDYFTRKVNECEANYPDWLNAARRNLIAKFGRVEFNLNNDEASQI